MSAPIVSSESFSYSGSKAPLRERIDSRAVTRAASERDLLEEALHVDREGIVFENIDAATVRIAITVEHRGTRPTPPTALYLESAALGAFLPWRPLGTIALPAMQPGETVTVEADARDPRSLPGASDRVPPTLPGTTFLFEDAPRGRAKGLGGIFLRMMMRMLGGDRDLGSPSSSTPMLGTLGDDLYAQRSVHWAGNLNVFVGRAPVERHVARALRVLAGKCNYGLFCVGDGRPDTYDVRIVRCEPEWQASLHDRVDEDFLPTELRLETADNTAVMIRIVPPQHAHQGSIDVEVRQHSSGKTARVEFTLDANARGAGCYVIA